MRDGVVRVVALGSAHRDLIAVSETPPPIGGSTLGARFFQATGGKAANQAAACARLGADARLIARLGQDGFGDAIAGDLAAAGVDLAHVARDPSRATGASVVLAAAGGYTSTIVPGAAGALSEADVASAEAALRAADALILQLETPTAISAAAAARATGAVVLNPAPTPPRWDALDPDLRAAVTLIVANEAEAASLAGRAVEDAADLRAVIGVDAVVTHGARGASAAATDGADRIDGFAAVARDAVGAGDAFLGAVVVARAEGASLQVALRRGCAAGAIAVGRDGGFGVGPTRSEIDSFLRRADATSAALPADRREG